MYSTTTALAAQASAFTDVGLLIAAAVATVLVAWASLVGLGFGLRKATKYVSGRKF